LLFFWRKHFTPILAVESPLQPTVNARWQLELRQLKGNLNHVRHHKPFSGMLSRSMSQKINDSNPLVRPP
jgi:hypothetical protein